MMRPAVGTVARLGAIAAIGLFSAASAKNTQSNQSTTNSLTAPAPRAMEPQSALGLWRTSFGPVKVELDRSKGPSHVMGVWVYERGGQEVIGYFQGPLRGNVLNFTWHEPATPSPLIGEGYLVFDISGTRFNGKWWTTDRTRQGDWNGWRADNLHHEGIPHPSQPPAPLSPADPHGGAGYGGSGYGGSGYGNTPPPPPPPPPVYPNGGNGIDASRTPAPGNGSRKIAAACLDGCD